MRSVLLWRLEERKGSTHRGPGAPGATRFRFKYVPSLWQVRTATFPLNLARWASQQVFFSANPLLSAYQSTPPPLGLEQIVNGKLRALKIIKTFLTVIFKFLLKYHISVVSFRTDIQNRIFTFYITYLKRCRPYFLPNNS